MRQHGATWSNRISKVTKGSPFPAIDLDSELQGPNNFMSATPLHMLYRLIFTNDDARSERVSE